MKGRRHPSRLARAPHTLGGAADDATGPSKWRSPDVFIRITAAWRRAMPGMEPVSASVMSAIEKCARPRSRPFERCEIAATAASLTTRAEPPLPQVPGAAATDWLRRARPISCRRYFHVVSRPPPAEIARSLPEQGARLRPCSHGGRNAADDRRDSSSSALASVPRLLHSWGSARPTTRHHI